MWIQVSFTEANTKFEINETEDKLNVRDTVSKRLIGNKTIAVLEDEGMLSALLCELLRQNGYKVLNAGSGQAALDKMSLHNGKVDLILADVRMPMLTGPAIISLLRMGHQGARWKQSKVLYVSGYPPEEAFEPGEEFEFLSKPFSKDTLLGKIGEILGTL